MAGRPDFPHPQQELPRFEPKNSAEKSFMAFYKQAVETIKARAQGVDTSPTFPPAVVICSDEAFAEMMDPGHKALEGKPLLRRGGKELPRFGGVYIPEPDTIFMPQSIIDFFGQKDHELVLQGQMSITEELLHGATRTIDQSTGTVRLGFFTSINTPAKTHLQGGKLYRYAEKTLDELRVATGLPEQNRLTEASEDTTIREAARMTERATKLVKALLLPDLNKEFSSYNSILFTKAENGTDPDRIIPSSSLLPAREIKRLLTALCNNDQTQLNFGVADEYGKTLYIKEALKKYAVIRNT